MKISKEKRGTGIMNKEKVLEILEAQRDSFTVDADNTKLSDYEEWCNAKAKDFQEIMD